MANLNPWLVLLIGVLIGWVADWIIELWFFRDKRLESERRVAKLEAEVKTQTEEKDKLNQQLNSLQSEHDALVATTATVVVDEAAELEAEEELVESEAVAEAAELEVEEELVEAEAVAEAGEEVEAEVEEAPELEVEEELVESEAVA